MDGFRRRVENSLREIREELDTTQKILTEAMSYVKQDQQEIVNAVDYGKIRVVNLYEAAITLGGDVENCLLDMEYEIDEIESSSKEELASCMKVKINDGRQLLTTLGQHIKSWGDITKEMSSQNWMCDPILGLLGQILPIANCRCKDNRLNKAEAMFEMYEMKKKKIMKESLAYQMTYPCEVMACTASAVAQAAVRSTEILHKMGLCIVDNVDNHSESS